MAVRRNRFPCQRRSFFHVKLWPAQRPRRGQPAQRCEVARTRTSEGKARSAKNALKHGLRAQKHVVLPAEDAAAFAAHEAALMEELAPEGALQTVLAKRIVAATWRLERAEKSRASCSPRTTTRAAGSASR
jgi:hypothetical protein